MDYRKHNSPDVNRVKPNQAESKPVGRLNPNPQPNGKKAKTEEEERKLDLNRFRKDKEIKGRPSPEINPKQNIGRESDCQRDNQQNNQRDTLRDMQRPAEAPLRQNDNQWLSRTNPSNLEQGNARRQNERK